MVNILSLKKYDFNSILILFAFILLFAIVIYVLFYKSKKEGFQGNIDFREDGKYKKQITKLQNRFEPMADGKRPVTELLNQKDAIPSAEQCLVNFYSLGCRYTGYIGPFEEGYFDPEKAVQLAVNAGCRTFVLEIDYIEDCKGDLTKYYPRIVVRDSQGKLRINESSVKPLCNSPSHNSIKDVCHYINFYGFSTAQNKTDPIIIVLYFLRTPPGGYKSKTVLDYYSNVAKSLEPFRDRLLRNEIQGGTFYRQKQESRLLINKITDYNDKVLIFSNANTSGFRENNIYKPMEDLDFLVNLRLGYTQTRLGITESITGANHGALETAEDFTIIPSNRANEVVENTKLKWTLCLSRDPAQPVSQDVYGKITSEFGVHCVPIQLFDDKNNFMFMDTTFKKYSFIPKPEELRYRKPPIVVPGEPNPNMNANQGKLRSPTI